MPIASGAMISARGIAPTTRAILLAERRRINDPLPAVFGSVEPHHASPVRSNRARALAVAMPMSKQRVGCATRRTIRASELGGGTAELVLTRVLSPTA